MSGERVDKVLAILLERSRSEVSALIAAGCVRLQGSAVERGHRKVNAGDVLEVDLEAPLGESSFSIAPNKAVPYEVVFEDGDLLVINKPAGVVVHPGAGHHDDTLVAGLLSQFPDLQHGAGDPTRPGIVHRLDKDTSGLLVVARSERAFAELSRQLKAHTIERVYDALVLGHIEEDRGVVDAPIGRSGRDRTKMAVSASGRAARTHYEVRARFVEPVRASLVAVSLETGRTHQIRVHFSAIGHPVAGDRRYGGALPGLGLDRPFLHASALALTHPRTGERLSFRAALAPELAQLLERFD